MTVTLLDIQRARDRIAAVLTPTPCARSPRLSKLVGAEVYLKLENLQPTGSFKERGALNKLVALTEAERVAGVIAASAGNHAQSVAAHAQRLGIHAVIVMPLATPLVKVTATRSFGAEVILHGESYDDAYQEAVRLQGLRGHTFVHPFDDDWVIAGQGTLGLEIVEQVPDVDAVVVPVGGGGLISGIAVAVKALRPSVRVYGVEAMRVPSMAAALEAGAPVQVPRQKTLADGIAARRVGERAFEITRTLVEQVVAVDDDQIAAAVLTLLEVEKTVAEGAAATPLAALMHGKLSLRGQRVVLVVSGGNIDVNLLARIIERGLLQSGRAVRLRVVVPDVPGALADLLRTVADCQANVLHVHHDRLGPSADLGHTQVSLMLETRGFAHIDDVQRAIRNAGWSLDV
jgi:threonine dehydratase